MRVVAKSLALFKIEHMPRFRLEFCGQNSYIGTSCLALFKIEHMQRFRLEFCGQNSYIGTSCLAVFIRLEFSTGVVKTLNILVKSLFFV